MLDGPQPKVWFQWMPGGKLVVRGVDGTVRDAPDDERQLARLSLTPIGPPPGWKPPRRGGEAHA